MKVTIANNETSEVIKTYESTIIPRRGEYICIHNKAFYQVERIFHNIEFDNLVEVMVFVDLVTSYGD